MNTLTINLKGGGMQDLLEIVERYQGKVVINWKPDMDCNTEKNRRNRLENVESILRELQKTTLPKLYDRLRKRHLYSNSRNALRRDVMFLEIQKKVRTWTENRSIGGKIMYVEYVT